MEIKNRIKLLCIILFCFIQVVSLGQSTEGIFYVPNATTAFGRILSKGTTVKDRNTSNEWSLTATTTSNSQTLTSTVNKILTGGPSFTVSLTDTFTVNYTDGVSPFATSGDIAKGDNIYIDTSKVFRQRGDTAYYNEGPVEIGDLDITNNVTFANSSSLETDDFSTTGTWEFEFFDGTRTDKDGFSATNMGLFNWLNAKFFTTTPTQSLTLNAGTSNIVREVGTTTTVTLRSITTNPSSLTLGVGTFVNTNPLITFVLPSTTDTSFNISFIPRELGGAGYTALSYQFYVTRPYTGDISGASTSSSRYCLGVYPYFTGESESDYSGSTGTTLYLAAGIDKDPVVESTSKTVSFTASDQYLYFAYPQSYGHLTSILDQNGFENITDFTETSGTVSSSGLIVDYTLIDYYIYKSNTKKTLTGFSYTFKQ